MTKPLALHLFSFFSKLLSANQPLPLLFGLGLLKLRNAFVIVALASSVVLAQDDFAKPASPMLLISGLGHLHHPVSTSNREAQQFRSAIKADLRVQP